MLVGFRVKVGVLCDMVIEDKVFKFSRKVYFYRSQRKTKKPNTPEK